MFFTAAFSCPSLARSVYMHTAFIRHIASTPTKAMGEWAKHRSPSSAKSLQERSFIKHSTSGHRNSV